jgi:hypothetical protein
MTEAKTIKPARHAFPGHAVVSDGHGGWHCRCGEPLRYWAFADGDEGPRIELTGRDAAKEAMRLHRAGLWLRWNAS